MGISAPRPGSGSLKPGVFLCGPWTLQRKSPLDTTAVVRNGTQGGEMLWGANHMLCGPEFTTATHMKVEGEARLHKTVL